MKNKKGHKKHLLRLIKKKPIFIVIILVIIIGIILINNNIYNINHSKIIKDTKLQELAFTKTSLVKTEDGYVLSMAVTNNTSKNCNITDIDIIIKDKDDNIIVTLPAYIDPPLTPGDTILLEVSTPLDLSKAYSKEIVEKNKE